jgi:hypothetical protein
MELTTKFRALAAVLASAILHSPSPARATTYFEAMEIGSSSSWGQRPDGRSYGTLPVWPLLVCPKNGFVIFSDEFSSDEIALLTRAIEEPDYKAMAASDNAHYRAAWLARKIGRAKAFEAALLMQAGWDSEEDAARKRRYQAEFAEVADGLSLDESENGDHFWLALRGVNALRELGQFDRAAVRLEKIKSAATYPTDAGEKEGADYLVGGLSDLIADKNDFAEPTNLIPRDIAEVRCKSGLALTGAELRACETPIPVEEDEEMSDEYESAEDAAAAAAAAAKAAGEAAFSAADAMKEEARQSNSDNKVKKKKPKD